jgi:thiamine biosynthesis protein ThiI
MHELLMVKYGEVILKGNNRPFFINTLIRNIRHALKDTGTYSIRKGQSVIYIEPKEDADLNQATDRLRKVFGIQVFHRTLKVEKDMEVVKSSCLKYFESILNESRSFKMESRRSDKDFPYRSQEMNNQLGQLMVDHFPHLKVDVHQPDVTLYVNVRKDGVYLYRDKEKGPGGLPVGTGGRAMILMSGGIDSPVAAWLIARRGVQPAAIHFHSYPYTGERSKKKVIRLAHKLSEYTGPFPLYIFPFTKIQEAIAEHCPPGEVTIIMRRMMMKSAEKLAGHYKSQALVTGESIGQVASQTMEGLTVTNAAVSLPVFRPLIGMDKDEIMDRARKIDTYNISIEPYQDCCTLFVPRHPQTKPRLGRVENSESKVDFESLIDEALQQVELVNA